jgi:hypothetical protein
VSHARAYAVVTGVVQQASNCDIILVHDNDLGFIGGAVSILYLFIP